MVLIDYYWSLRPDLVLMGVVCAMEQVIGLGYWLSPTTVISIVYKKKSGSHSIDETFIKFLRSFGISLSAFCLVTWFIILFGTVQLQFMLEGALFNNIGISIYTFYLHTFLAVAQTYLALLCLELKRFSLLDI